jgi:hypothetical protein
MKPCAPVSRPEICPRPISPHSRRRRRCECIVSVGKWTRAAEAVLFRPAGLQPGVGRAASPVIPLHPYESQTGREYTLMSPTRQSYMSLYLICPYMSYGLRNHWRFLVDMTLYTCPATMTPAIVHLGAAPERLGPADVAAIGRHSSAAPSCAACRSPGRRASRFQDRASIRRRST